MSYLCNDQFAKGRNITQGFEGLLHPLPAPECFVCCLIIQVFSLKYTLRQQTNIIDLYSRKSRPPDIWFP